MVLSSSSFSLYLLFFVVSFLFVLSWASFLRLYTPRRTIHHNYLIASFLYGIGAALMAFFIERALLFLLKLDFTFLRPTLSAVELRDLVLPAAFAFLFAAVIEESIKFFILRKYFSVESVNQIVDGMKVGLWLGLGFACVENAFYFVNFYGAGETARGLLITIVLRGIIATLAHALYGMVMGYYLALAKFHRMYTSHFRWLAWRAPILTHGGFNFLLLINVGAVSVVLLMALLIVVLLWYRQRKNLEMHVSVGGYSMIVAPWLAERIELEVLLAKEKAPIEAFQRILDLFPPKQAKRIPYTVKGV
ncbi:MAG: PrsW family intramembrane metalloprotease [Parcubacteria group bacterium]|nr:PrsW family intramembrane metalloprotease [Parcubacteria group bacterium]